MSIEKKFGEMIFREGGGSDEKIFDQREKEAHYEKARERHLNPTSVEDAFKTGKSPEKKIVDAANRVQKEFLHIMGDFGIGSEAFEKRAKEILENNRSINDYLKEGGKYLDVGCGRGHIMREIEKANTDKAVQFLGIDVYDYPNSKVQKQIALTRKREIEPKLREMEEGSGKDIIRMDFGKIAGKESQIFSFADAEKVPFKNNSLDGATMFYVLHHLSPKSQKKALEEAARIVGVGPDKYIFVLEETSDTPEQRKISARHDAMVNPELDAESPHAYKSDEEWKKVFEEAGLEIAESYGYRTGSVLGPLENNFYVLKKREENKIDQQKINQILL